MVKVSEEIKESLTSTKLAYLSTAARDGTPNVVPIGALKFIDPVWIQEKNNGYNFFR